MGAYVRLGWFPESGIKSSLLHYYSHYHEPAGVWDTLGFVGIHGTEEVVNRMVAMPGTKDYSSLSVAVRYYAEPKLSFHVSRNCFIPKPDVDSAVVKLKKRSLSQPEDLSREFLFRVIRASFSQRRKTLLNSLGNQPWLEGGKERLKEVLTGMGLSENIRAEALSVEQFIHLADQLCKKKPL